MPCPGPLPCLQGLRMLCQSLSCLTHLALSLRDAPDDAQLAALGRLTTLQHLSLGPLSGTTDAGMVQALSTLSGLTSLELVSVELVGDIAFAALAPCTLRGLVTLSLSRCYRLTDATFDSLTNLQGLTQLFISRNEGGLTANGLHRLICAVPALASLSFRGCAGISQADMDRLCSDMLAGRHLYCMSV